MHTPTRFSLGDATVTLLHLGDISINLAAWLGLTAGDWPPEYDPFLAGPIVAPIQCAHLAVAGRSVLVDACHPELLGLIETLPPGGASFPGLLEQLAAAAIDPAEIDTVVLTHPHFDHYCGLIAVGATPADDQLLFPEARHLLGRADWEASQHELNNPDSPVSRTLGLAARQGCLEPVDGARDLGDGMRLLPAPGETPGHQVLRLEAGGRVLYLLGDLYHHAVEIEREAWGVTWADAAGVAASRAQIVPAALAEDALLICSHIPGVGRLERTDSGVRWAPVEQIN